MLGGIAPIIIFSFPPILGADLFKTLAGIPTVGKLLPSSGIPIPLYLDEQLSGIYVESETKAIDIDTDIVSKYNADGTTSALINQSGINNLITINMIASKESVMLAALLAFNDIIFSKVVSGKYSISYLNKSITVFGGLLHSFSTSADANDDLLRIVMQIQKPNENKPTPTNLYYALPKITGATPALGAAS